MQVYKSGYHLASPHNMAVEFKHQQTLPSPQLKVSNTFFMLTISQPVKSAEFVCRVLGKYLHKSLRDKQQLEP